MPIGICVSIARRSPPPQQSDSCKFKPVMTEGEREDGREGKGREGTMKVPKTSLEFLHPVVSESALYLYFQVKAENSFFVFG